MNEPGYPLGPQTPVAPESVTVPTPNGPITVARNSVSPGYWEKLQGLASNLRQTVVETSDDLTDPLRLLDDLKSPTHGIPAAWDAAAPVANQLGRDLRSHLATNYPNLVAPAATPAAAPESASVSPAGAGSASPQATIAQAAMGTVPPAPAPQPRAMGPGASSSSGELDKAFSLQAKGLEEAQVVGAQKAAEQAGFEKEAQAQREAALAQQAQANAAYREARQRDEDSLRKAQGEYDSAKIDPKRFWAEKSTGDKILAGIGIALGAFGSSLNGGPNQALSIINNAMEKDIDAQKANLAKLGDSVAAKRTALGQLRATFQDDAQADSALRMMALDNVTAKIQGLASKYAAPEMHAKAETVLGQLAEQKAQLRSQFDERADAKARGWATLNLKQQEIGIDAMKALGGTGKVDTESQKTLREVEDRYKNIASQVNLVKAAVEKNGTWEATGPHNRQLELAITSLATDMAKLSDPSSVARESEVEAWKKNLFSPSVWTRDSTAQQLMDSFKALAAEKRATAYHTRGVSPPTEYAPTGTRLR